MNRLESGGCRISPTWARRTSLLEHSPPPQLVLAVVAVAAVVVAVGVVAQQPVEHPQPAEQLEQQHQPEPEQQMLAAVAVVGEVILFPHCADPQLSLGFRSCRGQQPSTITTRPMQ